MSRYIPPWSPYEGRTSIISSGRKTLTSAFADVVSCRSGFSSFELPQIFAAEEDEGENDAARDLVRLDAELLSHRFVTGKLQTFSRPLDGGEVEPIPAHHWELDDTVPRFATGAFNLDLWHDDTAELTHRIFVDERAFDAWLATLKPPGPLSNREIELVAEPHIRAARAVAARTVADTATFAAAPSDAAEVRPDPPGVGPQLLSVEEVSALIGRSRSSIYQDESSGAFPQRIKLGSSTRWKKTEVLAWIEEQAAKRGAH